MDISNSICSSSDVTFVTFIARDQDMWKFSVRGSQISLWQIYRLLILENNCVAISAALCLDFLPITEILINIK